MANSPAPVTIERAFQTAVDTVWASLTRPEILSEWFRAGIEVDLRPSGLMRDAQGDAGSFRAVDEPRSLAFAWGRPGEASVRVSMNLSGEGASAGLTLELSDFSDDAARARQVEFWHWAVDSLESFLKSGFGIPYEPWRELQAELHRRAAKKSAAEAEAERKAAGVVLAPLAEPPMAAKRKPAAAKKKPGKAAKKPKTAAKKTPARKPKSRDAKTARRRR